MILLGRDLQSYPNVMVVFMTHLGTAQPCQLDLAAALLIEKQGQKAWCCVHMGCKKHDERCTHELS